MDRQNMLAHEFQTFLSSYSKIGKSDINALVNAITSSNIKYYNLPKAEYKDFKFPKISGHNELEIEKLFQNARSSVNAKFLKSVK